MTRIAIVDGIRTPFAKAWTDFADIPAQDLGRLVVRELLERTAMKPEAVDEVIFGAVAQPPEASNVARVISLLAGIPKEKRAYTLSRNCASGIEAVTSAAEKIGAGVDNVVIAGGAESMSNIPLFYNREATKILLRLAKARTLGERLSLLLRIRPRHFLKPEVGLVLGLTDPVCGLNMGQTAEVLAKEFGITRAEQDEFALASHRRAWAAREKLREEIVPVHVPPKFDKVVVDDNGPRENQTLEDLAKMRPYFDRVGGSVTVGNACQVTDGACALLVMTEDKAKVLGYSPLGYLRDYIYVGVEPRRMGIGPAVAIQALLKKTGLALKDIPLFEINEAFAAQVIACQRQMEADGAGLLDRGLLNVNGGAVALGHPVGTSGARLILTLLKEMQRRNLPRGIASLCVGGGQGVAVLLER